MARNAKQVIARSVKDISAGLWCKNFLTQTFAEDDEHVLGCDATTSKDDKRMGCALGLISLYTENFGKPYKGYAIINGQSEKITFLPVQYPTDAKVITTAIRRSVEAVYNALPKGARLSKKAYDKAVASATDEYGVDEDRADLAIMQDRILQFNDRAKTTQKVALKWFTRALELL